MDCENSVYVVDYDNSVYTVDSKNSNKVGVCKGQQKLAQNHMVVVKTQYM